MSDLFVAYPAWRDAYDGFLESIFQHSGSIASLKNYRSVLQQFFKDGRDPQIVTKRDCEQFLLRKSSSRRNRGADLSASTRNFSLVVLGSFFKFASTFIVDAIPLYTKQIPTAQIKPMKRDIRPRNMPADAFTRLIESIDVSKERGARDVCLCLLLFWTSRRKAEIAGLRYGDFQITTVLEQGKSRQAVMFGYSPKGNSRSRVLQECPPEAWATIQFYLEKSKRKETITASDPLFATKYGGETRALSKSSMTAILKKRMREAGIDEKLYSVHSLRHSALAERYRFGQDILTIQSISGHRSLDMLRRYLLAMQGTIDTPPEALTRQFAHLTPR
jgi:integrase